MEITYRSTILHMLTNAEGVHLFIDCYPEEYNVRLRRAKSKHPKWFGITRTPCKKLKLRRTPVKCIRTPMRKVNRLPVLA